MDLTDLAAELLVGRDDVTTSSVSETPSNLASEIGTSTMMTRLLGPPLGTAEEWTGLLQHMPLQCQEILSLSHSILDHPGQGRVTVVSPLTLTSSMERGEMGRRSGCSTLGKRKYV